MIIQEYVNYASDQYDFEIHQILDKTILDQIQNPLRYNIIRVTDTKQKLAPLYERRKS